MPRYLDEAAPASATEQPRVFEVTQSMRAPALTHDPTTGQPVRRVMQGGYLNTRRWTKSPGTPAPAPAAAGGPCCGGGGLRPALNAMPATPPHLPVPVRGLWYRQWTVVSGSDHSSK